MKNSDLDVILWDFDGVLIRSNQVRDLGFELVLSSYPKEQVDKLMEFHKVNGGLSRYVKFRYFFEEIRSEAISESQVLFFAQKFSEIMRDKLRDPSLLIEQTLSFVKENYTLIPQYIVSGSDQAELRYLCREMGIHHFFKGIFGSPTPKKELVRKILEEISNSPEKCLLIGDSINDFDAAVDNGIQFWAFNNSDLLAKSTIDFSL